jgi:hypothetical protein
MKTDNADHMASGHQRIKILVDSSRDAGITSILVPASIAALILLFINKNYSVTDIFAISIFYLAFVILLLQNKTTVEVTLDSIIVHRPLLRSITLPKKSIVKTEVTKNINYRLRWIIRPVAIVALLFLIQKNITSLYINVAKSAPLIVKVITAYSIPLTLILLTVIFYHYQVRSRNPFIFKLITENREITFYANNIEEMPTKLGVENSRSIKANEHIP